MSNINFFGDTFLGGDLINSDFKAPFQNIFSFSKNGVNVINLEQVVSDVENELDKCTLHSNSSSVTFLKENNIKYVNLANNHIQDKGETGFFDMLSILEKNNIQYFGAGRNINDASRPVIINEKYSLLGYCDYGKDYLKKIQLATENEYGVNPLRKEKIFEDLKSVRNKAILYFHWGKENVWFPPYENIQLAKEILEHPKVLTIIGMHSHRLQGKINHKGKTCYFSLGNSMFPNFYLKPRTKICYPDKEIKCKSTYEYHPVLNTTYKKWKYSNRVSLFLNLDESKISEKFIKQNKNKPNLKLIKGFELLVVKKWYKLLSLIYSKSPRKIYLLISYFYNMFDKFIKMFGCLIYYFFKNNPKKSIGFLYHEIVKKKF